MLCYPPGPVPQLGMLTGVVGGGAVAMAGRERAGCSAQPRRGRRGYGHGTRGTWRPLQQKLKMSSGTMFPLTIFKRHLERRRAGWG